MFVLDIETLDTFESCVILSVGAVWFNVDQDFTVEQLRAQSFFSKFNAADQVKAHKRTISQDTLDFWKKQDDSVKDKNFSPKTTDVLLETGMADFSKWFKSRRQNEYEIVFTRGGLDYAALSHAAKTYPFEFPINYWQIRDVRTAVDILTGSTNGYCKSTLDLSSLNKHDPVDDCIIDAAMLKYFVPAG